MSADQAKLGLALGSGGARGFCHIGVLDALAERGIKPDVIAGCSMGALVGAAYAGGKLDPLRDWARSITPTNFLGLLDLRFAGGGLVEGREIAGLLDRLGLPDRIEDLDLPFVCVATDFNTGREVWFDKGPLAPAVRASVAIPGIFSPVERDGRWLIDGGLVNPVPVSLARAMGAEVTIAVDPNARPDGVVWKPAPPREGGLTSVLRQVQKSLPAPMQGLLDWGARGPVAPGYLEVVSHSIDIMTGRICQARLAGDPPQVLLAADLSSMSVLDFHEARRAMEEGARLVKASEAAIDALCAP